MTPDPSNRRRQRAAIVLALVGSILAGYLTWVHYDASALVCGLGNCHTVQASEFATIGPFPVALLGLGMYLMILACNALGLARPRHRRPPAQRRVHRTGPPRRVRPTSRTPGRTRARPRG